jgi:poly(A) polymerase/tRNA nucleotidyltransferase (CCA-adding enzyme)
VGNPSERFREDKLRMLRMCRFVGKLAFSVETKTFEACQRLSYQIWDIPAERIKEELFKILETTAIQMAFDCLDKTQLIDYLLPELARLRGMEQPTIHHEFTVFVHSLQVASALTKENPLLRFAGLVHDIGKTQLNPNPPPIFADHIWRGVELFAPIAQRFKLSNYEKKYIQFMITHHMDASFNKAISRRGVRKYLSEIPSQRHLEELFYLMRADVAGRKVLLNPDAYDNIDNFLFKIRTELEEVKKFKSFLHKRDLLINGNDLIEMGVPPSPMIGRILNGLLDDVLEDPTRNHKSYLKKRAEEIYRIYSSDSTLLPK